MTMDAQRPTGPVRVYVSGPMTGLPALNFPAFHEAAAQLRGAGLAPVNPAELNPDPGASWHDCMRTDIKAMCDCEGLALLAGWEDSDGANLELHIAHRLGLTIAPLERWVAGNMPHHRTGLPPAPPAAVSLQQVLEIRDECMPSQGEGFDWMRFVETVLLASAGVTAAEPTQAAQPVQAA